MILNYIWVFFFVVAFVIALFKLIFLGDVQIFSDLINSTFDNSKLGFTISLYLTGAMTLWLGIMRIGEKGGMIELMSRAVAPLFSKLFPEVPKGHPAVGAIIMNLAANMLGLDNAATPMGLKAMKELQTLNPQKDTASNAQIMFLVLNTSGLTIIPVSIMALRAGEGAANPSDVFIPILLTTFFSTLAGIIVTSLIQKINLLNRVVLLYLGTFSLLISGIIYYFMNLPAEQVGILSSLAGNLILFSIIVAFILFAFFKKVNVYEAFIEGAKEGFHTSVSIIPYLIAILVAIGAFRTSGAMGYLMEGVKMAFDTFRLPTDFVDALPTAFMKPLSGGGARGMFVEAMHTHGVDSFVGKLAATFQGSTDTTFYVLAVYFGSVGIKKTRYAISAGLFADLVGIIAAIFLAYIFYQM